MVNKDENTDINKEDSLENSGNNPPVKRGRPKKIKEDIPKEEAPEMNEGGEPVLEENDYVQNEENPEENTMPEEKEELVNEEEKIESEVDKTVTDEQVPENIIPEETPEEINSEEEPIGIIPVPEEDTKVEETEPEEKITRRSNYQISLVDENHLRARVLTGKLVSIDCSVRDKFSAINSLSETHTNKIFVHPKEKPQEVEIMVSIGAAPLVENEEVKEEIAVEKIEKESNYQVSLVDENLLRIIIVTEKSVSIDCSVKDDIMHTDGSNETQANKIFLHPKEKPQEIEIIVSIGNDGNVFVRDVDRKILAEEKTISTAQQKGKLTPNPLVANLIQTFSDTPLYSSEDSSLTPEERLEEKLGPKNPWRIYKEMMQRNLMVGLVGAVLIYIISIVSFYSSAAKKSGNADVVDAPRLVIMQDLPENQFQQQNVEDPNKPKEEEKTESDDGTNTNKIPPIVPKKIRPPRVIGPTKQKVDTTNNTAIDKELDSLRKLHNTNVSNNINTGDSSKKITGNYPIPDSIMKGLKDNEVGLVGKFPPYWKQIDSREVDINKKEFTGVILVDTSVKKKEEALNMSVQLDKNNEYWKQYSFKNIFSEDSLKNVIYNIEPKQEGDQTYYRFYISGMAYNIYIAAFINNEHFEKHKAEIEQVVRTIRIQKPAVPPGKN